MSGLESLAESGLLLPLVGLLGLAVGSFLNVVIHRLPIMMEREWAAQCADLRGEPAPEFDALSLMWPRSRCPKCGHGITALENIPVLSWLLLRGRCRGCGTSISARYPLIELLTGLLTLACAWSFGPTTLLIGGLAFVWALIALTFIDLDTQLLPDSITLPLIWAGLLLNLTGGFTDLVSSVIGAMAGYLVLWAVYWAFKLATGKEGMGYGDFKLLAAIGAFLGWQILPVVILLSSLVGAVVGIGLIALRSHGRDVPIPFGPYLAAAGVIALFFGELINRTYLGLM
ncbi:MAG: A24 family peptidase [Methyloversatilis sp.]|uniref:prepilin peptidase n=1 Tax=Methyloversatilis sp. TaxID=2569862 RepID=UPI0025D6E84D|nr:A24 family peptidase [Methyloversatilis sp.]MCR6668348.1 A24 family peptidase [Methyloversatilis sp.]